MKQEILSQGFENSRYYPQVSAKVARQVEELWTKHPELMRMRTRAQIGELSPNLAQLIDIMQKFGEVSPDLPSTTGHTISEGMMRAFSMLHEQAQQDNKRMPALEFDTYELCDQILPRWGLLESKRPTDRITSEEIITPFLMRDHILAQTMLDDSQTRANRTYFLAGAALVTQLYYNINTTHP